MNLLMKIMNEVTDVYYKKQTVVSTETFIIQSKQVKDCDFSFYNKGKMLSPVTAPVIFTGSFHAHRTSVCYWFHVTVQTPIMCAAPVSVTGSMSLHQYS